MYDVANLAFSYYIKYTTQCSFKCVLLVILLLYVVLAYNIIRI